jgi:ComF family protein
MRLKFGGQKSVAEPFAAWMVDALRSAPPPRVVPGGGGFLVSWVPLGPKRRRARGFDQAELLARAVAARTGWPVDRLLARVVETAPQARRSGQERQAALRGAFETVARPLPEAVLLVDDVLTSGATAAECARVLIGNGVREIGVLTAARALGSGLPDRCYNPPGLQPGSVVARERFSR